MLVVYLGLSIGFLAGVFSMCLFILVKARDESYFDINIKKGD